MKPILLAIALLLLVPSVIADTPIVGVCTLDACVILYRDREEDPSLLPPVVPKVYVYVGPDPPPGSPCRPHCLNPQEALP